MSFSKVVTTEVGKFRITRTNDVQYDPMTREPRTIGITIGVGGRKDVCVFLTAPNGGNTAKLHNVRTRNLVCEVTGRTIQKERTVHMMNLAFTVLKEEAPHIRFVELDDNSEFPCNYEEGRPIGMSLALYELAYHRSTWYERHFGAELNNEALKALYKKNGFFVPKAPIFDFKHPTLQKELSPIYQRTATWKEFFDELYKLDGKCNVLLPWYKDALKQIMGGISFEGQDWRIDLSNPILQTIVYTNVVAGGRRTARRPRSMTYEYVEDVSRIRYSPSDFRIDDRTA